MKFRERESFFDRVGPRVCVGTKTSRLVIIDGFRMDNVCLKGVHFRAEDELLLARASASAGREQRETAAAARPRVQGLELRSRSRAVLTALPPW